MTRNEFIRRFPNASESTIAKNCPAVGTKLPTAESQRDQTKSLVEAVPGETQGVERTRIRFTQYRVRLLDPDNATAACKDLLDGLQVAQIIKNDSEGCIALEVHQVKVDDRAYQKTVIEIIW